MANKILITNTTFKQNQALRGGAMAIEKINNMTFVKNTFDGNDATLFNYNFD